MKIVFWGREGIPGEDGLERKRFSLCVGRCLRSVDVGRGRRAARHDVSSPVCFAAVRRDHEKGAGVRSMTRHQKSMPFYPKECSQKEGCPALRGGRAVGKALCCAAPRVLFRRVRPFSAACPPRGAYRITLSEGPVRMGRVQVLLEYLCFLRLCGGAKKAFPRVRKKAFRVSAYAERGYTSKSISRSSLVRDFQES